MRNRFKHFISLLLIPLTRWYLRKKRRYSYKGTTVTVMPGVFHPGLFNSTTFLIDYLKEQPLSEKSVLELGCGTGLISITAAKAGAQAYASDLSIAAVENTVYNAAANGVSVHTIHSDLFSGIEKKAFDWILINPPYYRKAPRKESELAWFCGSNFEYYQKLFTTLQDYIHPTSVVIMVLTQATEIETIFSIGAKQQFQFELVSEKKVFFDGKDFLFRIKPMITEGARVTSR